MNISKLTLESALDSASFPVVAALLVHFTGDISILEKLPRPNQAVLGEIQGFLSEDDKQIIKKIALKEISKFFSNHEINVLLVPSNNELNKIMILLVVEHIHPDYIPMLLRDLNLHS